MSEIISQEEIQEGQALLKGEAVVQFEKPSIVIIETEDGYEEVATPGWVKFSTAFRNKMLKKLKGAKLAVFMSISLHVNENGTSFPGIELIAEETGYDRDTVMMAIAEMEEMDGVLSVMRQQGKKNVYRPYWVARGNGNEPVQKIRRVGKSDSTSSEKLDYTSPEKLDSKKKESKKKDAVDFILEQATVKEKLEADATNCFEVAFGFDKLPWWSGGSSWDRFLRFVVKAFQSDPSAFAGYVDWRKDAGKFVAMSNVKIRQSPQIFMDTSWAEFMATRQPVQQPAKIIRAADEKPRQPVPDFILQKQAELHARGEGLKKR